MHGEWDSEFKSHLREIQESIMGTEIQQVNFKGEGVMFVLQ